MTVVHTDIGVISTIPTYSRLGLISQPVVRVQKKSLIRIALVTLLTLAAVLLVRLDIGAKVLRWVGIVEYRQIQHFSSPRHDLTATQFVAVAALGSTQTRIVVHPATKDFDSAHAQLVLSVVGEPQLGVSWSGGQTLLVTLHASPGEQWKTSIAATEISIDDDLIQVLLRGFN